MKILALDIEAKTNVDFDKPWEAGMSICCTWDNWSGGHWGRYRFFQDGKEDMEKLCELLEIADVVVTFNGDRYDLPVLEWLWGQRLPIYWHCDLMRLIVAALGYRRSLESVSRATLGRGKSGHGLGALEYFRLGYWGKLCTYCMDDVALTASLFLYAQRFGLLWQVHKETNVRLPIPVSVPGGVEHIWPVRGEQQKMGRGVM